RGPPRGGRAGARRVLHPPDVGAPGRHGPGRLPRPGDDLVPLRLSPTLRDDLAAQEGRGDGGRPLVGIWVCSGSPLVAEICAGSGVDWLLVDMEHSPNGLESVLTQLQAVAAYPV